MCEIYFQDLTQSAQTLVLQHFKISSAAELNLDCIPIAILPAPEDFMPVTNETDLPDYFQNAQQMREAEMSVAFLNYPDLPY